MDVKQKHMGREENLEEKLANINYWFPLCLYASTLRP